MPNKKWSVRLTVADRQRLLNITTSVSNPQQVKKRALVLLDSDESDERYPATASELKLKTKLTVNAISIIKRRFVEGGIDAALAANFLRKRKCTATVEERIYSIYRSQPPKGKKYWSYQDISSKLVSDGLVKSISCSTVRLVLNKCRTDAERIRTHKRVKLDMNEKQKVNEILKSDSTSAHVKKLAQILIDLDEGCVGKPMPVEWIARERGIGTNKIYRIKKRFLESGLDMALNIAEKPQYHMQLDDESKLIIEALLSSDDEPDNVKKRARVLLSLDESNGQKPKVLVNVSESAGMCRKTVQELRKRYIRSGLSIALYGKNPA